MPISQFDLRQMTQRTARAINPAAAKAKDEAAKAKWAAGEEKSLQEAIQKDCERRGYFVLRSRMDKKTVYRKGFPDLVIFGPKGKCVLIECKAGDNQLSDDQRLCIQELRAAGAWVLVTYDLASAIEFVKDYLPI